MTWDEKTERTRIINTSRGIDMREAWNLRLKKRIDYQDVAKAMNIRLEDIIDYEHEIKPIPEDRYEAYIKIVDGGK